MLSNVNNIQWAPQSLLHWVRSRVSGFQNPVDYLSARALVIKATENARLFQHFLTNVPAVQNGQDIRLIHDDSAYIPTFGYGLAFIVHPEAARRAIAEAEAEAVLNHIFETATTQNDADVERAIALVGDYVANRAVTVQYIDSNGNAAQIDVVLTASDIIRGAQGDAIFADGRIRIGYDANGNPQYGPGLRTALNVEALAALTTILSDLQQLELDTEQLADTMYEIMMDGLYEVNGTTVIGGGIGTRVFRGFEQRLTDHLGAGNDLPQSIDRLALLNAQYNGVVGQGIRQAIVDNSRARAWWELRFNIQGNPALQARRNDESDMLRLVSLSSSGGANGSAPINIDEYKLALATILGGTLSNGATVPLSNGQRTPYLYDKIVDRISDARADLEFDSNPDFIQDFWDVIAEERSVVEAAFATVGGVQYDIHMVQMDMQTGGHSIVAKDAHGLMDANNVTLNASNTNNLIFGEDGNDTLNGLGGTDFLYGGDGQDILIGGEGHDFLFGGDNLDTADYSSNSTGIFVASTSVGDSISVNDGTGNDLLFDIERVNGSSEKDNFEFLNSTLFGLTTYSFFGLGGDDEFRLEDVVSGFVIDGGADNDTVRVEGLSNLLELRGGAGEGDTLDYSRLTSNGLNVSLDGLSGTINRYVLNNNRSRSSAPGDTVSGFETIIFSSEADTVTINSLPVFGDVITLDGGDPGPGERRTDTLILSDQICGNGILGADVRVVNTGNGSGYIALGPNASDIVVRYSNFERVEAGDCTHESRPITPPGGGFFFGFDFGQGNGETGQVLESNGILDKIENFIKKVLDKLEPFIEIINVFTSIFGLDLLGSANVASSSASLDVDPVLGTYELGSVTSKNNGSEFAVSEMARATADALNVIVEELGGDDDSRLLSGTDLSIKFGLGGDTEDEANDVFVEINGVKHLVNTPLEAVELAVSRVIEPMQFAGGNIFVKRALSQHGVAGLEAFGNALRAAKDYTTYMRNTDSINSRIAEGIAALSTADKDWYTANEATIKKVLGQDITPLTTTEKQWFNDNNEKLTQVLGEIQSNAVFAVNWITAIQNANDLGLQLSSESDFYGGAKGFLDSLKGVIGASVDYNEIAFRMSGQDLHVLHDGNRDGWANTTSNETLFVETGFTRAVGHADGGVGYNYVVGNENNLTSGNDFFAANANTGAVVNAGSGDDIILSGGEVRGGDGDDWISGSADADADRLYGGNGNDVIIARAGNDILWGEEGDDFLYAGSGKDDLRGGNGNDVMVNSDNGTHWWARGGSGNDTYLVGNRTGWQGWVYDGAGNNAVDYGNDTISYENVGWGIELDMNETKPLSWQNSSSWLLSHTDTQYFSARATDGSSNAITMGVHKVENVTGTFFADVISGNDKNNILRGGGGDDVLNGAGGIDVLEGGSGADRLERGRNNAGSWGVTTVSYESSFAGVDVSIQRYASLGGQHAFGGHAQGDVFVGYMHHLTGSDHSDVLEGNHGSNVIRGMDGDDYIFATRGSDNIDGGEGFDTIDYSGHQGAGGLIINAYGGGRTSGYENGVNAAGGSALLNNIEHVVGTKHDDKITTGDGDNLLEGGLGNDTLIGGKGNDIYFVEIEAGKDTIEELAYGGHDTIMVGDQNGLSWDDIWISDAGDNFALSYRPETGSVIKDFVTATQSPNNEREQVGVDSVDIGGVGAVDIWFINGGVINNSWGTTENDTIQGTTGVSGRSVLQGFDGNDYIYAAETAAGYEDNSNFLHGGRGNDVIYASVGDDQYIFDRGSGIDTIFDTGGLDHIQFGPGVDAGDLIFEVNGRDLIIGILDEGLTDGSGLSARDMDSYLTIKDGAYVKHIIQTGVEHRANLIEYVTVQNNFIDLREENIDWIVDYVDLTTTPPAETGPGPGDTNWNIPPVMFDLDGDGLELISINASHVVVKGEDRSLARIGWLGGDDGFLALDRDGDGKITSLSEISFVQDLEGARTDMEALIVYDTNGDGVLDSSDTGYGEFLVWRDINQNGKSSANELMTLEEAGIASINLNLSSTGNNETNFGDNIIYNTADFTWSDGAVGTAYDVGLASSLIQEGRESRNVDIGVHSDFMSGELGRLSTQRISHLEEEINSDHAAANVSNNGEDKFVKFATRGAWAKLAGFRSNMLARMRSDHDVDTEIFSSDGFDTGYTQDELLSEFDNVSVTEVSDVQSSSQGLLFTKPAELSGSSEQELLYTKPAEFNGVVDQGLLFTKPALFNEDQRSGETVLDEAIVERAREAFMAHWNGLGSTLERLPERQGLFIASQLRPGRHLYRRFVAAFNDNHLSVDTDSIQSTVPTDATIATAIDLFAQAMAGFGAETAFDGFKPDLDERDIFQNALASAPTWRQTGTFGPA